MESKPSKYAVSASCKILYLQTWQCTVRDCDSRGQYLRMQCGKAEVEVAGILTPYR